MEKDVVASFEDADKVYEEGKHREAMVVNAKLINHILNNQYILAILVGIQDHCILTDVKCYKEALNRIISGYPLEEDYNVIMLACTTMPQ